MLFSAIYIIIHYIHTYKKEGNPLKTLKLNVFKTLTCQLKVCECPGSDFEIFSSLNCSKFTVECDWSSQISQIRTKIGFFLKKKIGLLLKKNILINIGKGGKFAVECASNGIISWKCLFHLNCEFFSTKSPKIFECGKITKFDEERVFFERKTLCSFWKASSAKLVGGKHIIGRQACCYSSLCSKLVSTAKSLTIYAEFTWKVHWIEK